MQAITELHLQMWK